MQRLGYRPQGVAEMLGCSGSKVYDLIARGELRAFRLSKKRNAGVCATSRSQTVRR